MLIAAILFLRKECSGSETNPCSIRHRSWTNLRMVLAGLVISVLSVLWSCFRSFLRFLCAFLLDRRLVGFGVGWFAWRHASASDSDWHAASSLSLVCRQIFPLACASCRSFCREFRSGVRLRSRCCSSPPKIFFSLSFSEWSRRFSGLRI